MSFASATHSKKARIEIIPLIDVIFFLLATFVLFTLSLNKIQSLPVDLPQAAPSAPPTKNDDDLVVLQLSDAGTAYWNKELISINEITPRLFDYKASHAAPRILISGDDKASYGATIRALDEVRKAGITHVSIETAWRASGR
ncbi:biopolymer transporter ExbD [Opitutaceae bacterium TAV4]|uniref:ExbD/TolR family protein n=1 Tax=Geminisphaera colitermitum TaxID=1148786 RepID=UPI000158D38A|nr:biopolymer transporter ExbD [Geminisphaera colitermitum]RRJ96663.1 biopolymer transporter ExbD [Opitutaceae bacterium TAV4]RRK00712.1 biopolymer transporter ExbD [Opitutaceae bacterium TAV3]